MPSFGAPTDSPVRRIGKAVLQTMRPLRFGIAAWGLGIGFLLWWSPSWGTRAIPSDEIFGVVTAPYRLSIVTVVCLSVWAVRASKKGEALSTPEEEGADALFHLSNAYSVSVILAAFDAVGSLANAGIQGDSQATGPPQLLFSAVCLLGDVVVAAVIMFRSLRRRGKGQPQ